MLDFPNAKINLGLHILDRRSDGYHDIDTCFYPVPSMVDALEILPAEQSTVQMLGTSEDIPLEENLVWRALQSLKTHHPFAEDVLIILQKNIPTGAGLGGGSADAAWTLRMLDDLLNLSIPKDELESIAVGLGADVPFFIRNKPCIATGIGEVMTPTDLDLSQYRIEIVPSDIHVSTAWAFGQVVPQSGRKPIRQIIQQPIDTWRDELYNDFEEVVYARYPALAQHKAELYQQGAIYASLTGTGSAVYGIFPSSS